MKKTNRTTSRIVRNGFIFNGFSGKTYGSRVYEVGGGYLGTLMWVSTERIVAMSGEEFTEMLKRHGII